jgi:UDP-N-acetylmuramoylalanine--D-glutamate ligase
VEFDASDELPSDPRIPGTHNRENAAAATAAARTAGIGDDAIAEGLRNFAGVPHRIELVRELRGVRYVNDSKATNVAATLRALASFPDSRLHVILGGRGKAEPYGPLAAAFTTGDRTYVIGEAAQEIEAAFDVAGVAYADSGNLQSALAEAAANAAPGDVVLLSPACASFDQFDNFEARGDAFRRLVEELA